MRRYVLCAGILFLLGLTACGKAADDVTPTATVAPTPTPTVYPIPTESPTPLPEPTIPVEIDFFADYNGEKIQRIVSEEGDVYTPSMCNDVIFYRADEEETLEEILVAMKTAIMEPLTIPSEGRPFTVTAYDVSSQEKIVELEENMWCLPVLEGKYKFDGMDFVAMEDRLEFEEPDENGLVDFLRQGSASLFQFILLKEGDVYRLQRLVRMCEIAPELKKYEEPEATPAAGPLTEEEIKFFNEKFFTAETEYPGRWVRNNILYTEFTNPTQVDIEAMLYDENGEEEISEEEYAYLRQQAEELFDTSKLTTAYINELMQTYLGISLEESEKKGLDKFFYNAEYDAYYLMHSDALCVSVQVEKGVRNEDGTITLVYLQAGQPFTHLTKAEIEKLPQYQVVLKETENGYQFLSNQMVTQ